jgi:site-specific recombinase XerD
MLRHACGFKLANDGHDTRAIQAYLGHRSIMSTVRYTALTPNRFKNFWKDYVSRPLRTIIRAIAIGAPEVTTTSLSHR